MNRPDHTSHLPHPDEAAPRPDPARPGPERLHSLPLLGAALLLAGALLYAPHLAPWQHALATLIVVAGGAALALRAPRRSERLPSWEPASAAAMPAPSAPRSPLRPIARAASPAPAPTPHDPAPAADGGASAADALTGSYSQHECRKMLALMFVRASRFHSPLAMVMVRLEQRDRIGSLFGPAAADTVLVELAAFLQQQVRASDVVARWDDAAFALLLPGTAQDEAEELAARLRAHIGRTFFAGFGHLSCAIGVADNRQHRSAEALANAAARLAMPVTPPRHA